MLVRGLCYNARSICLEMNVAKLVRKCMDSVRRRTLPNRQPYCCRYGASYPKRGVVSKRRSSAMQMHVFSDWGVALSGGSGVKEVPRRGTVAHAQSDAWVNTPFTRPHERAAVQRAGGRPKPFESVNPDRTAKQRQRKITLPFDNATGSKASHSCTFVLPHSQPRRSA